MKLTIKSELLLAIALTILLLTGTASAVTVTGVVTDTQGNPVFGASVIVHSAGKPNAGTAADERGWFRIKKLDFENEKRFGISAIGYEPIDTLVRLADDAPLHFQLTSTMVSLGPVVVTPQQEVRPAVLSVDHEQIAQEGTRSLVPSNPVGVIRHPQVARQGSVHSSKLRINGTNPNYFINGIPIGTDPNHYGIFSIVPASAIDKLEFYPQGTHVRYSLPSIVALSTPTRFGRHFSGEASLSAVEALASVSFGGKRYFAHGSLRKSVLDKLVKRLDVDSDRRTIPPTNFEDIFASVGLKLSETQRIFVDQYHVRDYLSIQSKATIHHATGLTSFQSTDEHFVGLRYQVLYDGALLHLSSSVRSSSENYGASPIGDDTSNSLNLDLKESGVAISEAIEIEFMANESEICVGAQAEQLTNRHTSMDQINWNLLPPDANSDNPQAYQPEINQLYGHYDRTSGWSNYAIYVSRARETGRLRLESGLRLSSFNHLSQRIAFAARQSAIISTSEISSLHLFLGTFAENPVNRLLEPYQVLIRNQANELTPIKTKLISASFAIGPLKTGLFAKQITNLPVLTPDLSRVSEDGVPQDGFVAMRSTGQIDFIGSDISLTLNGLLSSRVDLYAFYGYTWAEQETDNIRVPYELNARHRFAAQLDYHLTNHWTFGGDLAIRSGYPYTPSPEVIDSNSDEPLSSIDRNSEAYNRRSLEIENSATFAPSMSLNLHLDVEFGRSNLFLNVSNITDHANAIINTTDGFIYDAGILPSIGYRVKW